MRSLRSLVDVVDTGSRLELARVDAEVGELADVGVAHDLERQRRERLVVGRPCARSRLLVFGSLPSTAATSSGARQVVDDRVEQGLHALVLERGAAEHGHEVDPRSCRADPRAEVVGGDLLVADVLLEDGLVDVRDDVEELVAPVVGVGLELGRDVDGLVALALAVVPTTSAFIARRSITPRNSFSAPIGSWTSATFASRRSLIMSTQRSEVGADAVHLVDEAHAGHVVLVGLAPDRLGLRLDAGDRVEHRDRAVEDAQAALDLDGEVDVAGRVDDVDPACRATCRWSPADVIVMPRSCSWAIQSMTAAPSWTSPIL